MFLSFGAAGAFGLAAILSWRQGSTRWFMLAPALLWLAVGFMHRRRLKAAPTN
ncbi:MAG TPA: hypothetical protein VJ623_05755 [Holophagaceae bacterium]|nr:hypothetical protein [Holophagaceae bacterium]